MSFSGVRGRSMRRGVACGSSPLVLRLDVERERRAALLELDRRRSSPIFTPATCTLWPWPGVTAWALSSSTYMRTGSVLPREAHAAAGEDVARRRRARSRRGRGSPGPSLQFLRIARIIAAALLEPRRRSRRGRATLRLVAGGEQLQLRRSAMRDRARACAVRSRAAAELARVSTLRGGGARASSRGSAAPASRTARRAGTAGMRAVRRRVDARDRLERGAEQAVAEVERLRAALAEDLEPLAVGVERAALAGEAGQELAGLLVDRARRRERRVGHRLVAARHEHLVRAARPAGAAARAAARSSRASAASGGVAARRSRGQAAQLVLADEAAQLADERRRVARAVGPVERTPGRAARAKRAHGRERVVERRRAPGSAARSVPGSSRTRARRSPSLAASARDGAVEVA